MLGKKWPSSHIWKVHVVPQGLKQINKTRCGSIDLWPQSSRPCLKNKQVENGNRAIVWSYSDELLSIFEISKSGKAQTSKTGNFFPSFRGFSIANKSSQLFIHFLEFMTFVDKFLRGVNLADDTVHYFSSTALLREWKGVTDTMGFAVDYRSSMPITSIVSSPPVSYSYSSDTLSISYTCFTKVNVDLILPLRVYILGKLICHVQSDRYFLISHC